MIINLRRTGQFAKFAAQVEEVDSEVRRLAALMGLEDWTFSLRFKNIARSENQQAQTRVEWCYRSAYMDFDLKAIRDEGGGTWKTLPATVRHEMLHIPLWRLTEFAAALVPKGSPFKDLLTAHEEDLVETICGWPIWNEGGKK